MGLHPVMGKLGQVPGLATGQDNSVMLPQPWLFQPWEQEHAWL